MCQELTHSAALQAATVSQLKAELALPFAGSFSPASLLPGAPPHTGSESLGALQAAAAATSGAAAPAPEGEGSIVRIINLAHFRSGLDRCNAE